MPSVLWSCYENKGQRNYHLLKKTLVLCFLQQQIFFWKGNSKHICKGNLILFEIYWDLLRKQVGFWDEVLESLFKPQNIFCLTMREDQLIELVLLKKWIAVTTQIVYTKRILPTVPSTQTHKRQWLHTLNSDYILIFESKEKISSNWITWAQSWQTLNIVDDQHLSWKSACGKLCNHMQGCCVWWPGGYILYQWRWVWLMGCPWYLSEWKQWEFPTLQ